MEESDSNQDDCNNENVKKIVAIGRNGAGRSRLVYRLATGEMLPKDAFVTTLDMMSATCDDLNMWFLDYNGRHHEERLYRLSCMHAAGIIFMIDSADPSNFDEALEYLNWIFQNEELKDVTVMVVANKQDLDDAVGPEVIEKKIKKNCKIRHGFTVFVMPMSVTSEDDHSLQLAYRLLVKTIKRQDAGRAKKGLIPHAWETAEKDAEDSGIDDNDDEREKKKDAKKEKKKFILKDPIHMLKSLLIR